MTLFAPLLAVPAAAQGVASPTVRQAAGGSGALVSVNEVVENPWAYIGREVMVASEIRQVLGPRSFTIGDRGFFDLGLDNLLVISTRPLPGLQFGLNQATGLQAGIGTGTGAGAGTGAGTGAGAGTAGTLLGVPQLQSLLAGDAVVARGPVRLFALVEIEQSLGLDLDDALYADWEGRPVLIASNLALEAPVLREIVQYPAAFVGQSVTLSGRITQVIGPRSFTMADERTGGMLTGGGFAGGAATGGGLTNGSAAGAGMAGRAGQLLVVSEEPIPGLQLDLLNPGLVDPWTAPAWTEAANALVGAAVEVRGPVQLFVLADVENALGLDLYDDLLLDWERRPALIAEELAVLPSPDVRGAGANFGRLVTVDQVADNPAAFINTPVAVTGWIDEMIGLRAFTTEDEDSLFQEEILVLSTSPLTSLLAGQIVPDFGEGFGPAVGTGVGTGLDTELGVDIGMDLGTGFDTGIDEGVDTGIGTGFDDGVGAYYGADAEYGEEEYAKALEDRKFIAFGMLRTFNRAEVEREVGYALDDPRLSEWEGRPVLIATDLAFQAPRFGEN